LGGVTPQIMTVGRRPGKLAGPRPIWYWRSALYR
jgi:hypothetical protein